ncbi:MAG: glycosyltransferase [Betaproteobacteria bacterium]|nr:glycosyltransferase [Betaproteobacteria bacterium]
MRHVAERHVIAHVIGALCTGGAERFVVDLLCELKQQGAAVRLIVLSSRTDPVGQAMAKQLEAHGVCFATGPSARLGLRTVFWYGREIRRLKPSLVHLHTANTDLTHYLMRMMYGVAPRIVRTVHSTTLNGRWDKRLALRGNRAAVTIGCGHEAATSCRTLVTGEIATILNGVRFAWPMRDMRGSQARKHALGLDVERLHYLSVGRMDAHRGGQAASAPKAHDVLIRAWQRSHLGEAQGTLHLIGDGDLRGELESLAAGDPSILFHGVRSDVPDWLVAADCFVMASRWEGLPLAGIEAVGTGLPCIFSDIPSLKELGAPVAYWVPVDDADALCRRLRRFAEERRYPTEAATNAIRQRFGVASVARRYGELYERVLSAPLV